MNALRRSPEIGLVISILLWMALRGHFICDDFNFLYITQRMANPLLPFITDHFDGVFWRPLGVTAWDLLNLLFGTWYAGYSLALGTLHLMNGLLVGRIATAIGMSEGQARLARIVFWLSPAGLMTVAWMSDFFYGLAGLGLLGGTWLLLNKPQTVARRIGGGVALALAMCSHDVTIALCWMPVALWIVSQRRPIRLAEFVRTAAIPLGTGLTMLGIRMLVTGHQPQPLSGRIDLAASVNALLDGIPPSLIGPWPGNRPWLGAGLALLLLILAVSSYRSIRNQRAARFLPVCLVIALIPAAMLAPVYLERAVGSGQTFFDWLSIRAVYLPLPFAALSVAAWIPTPQRALRILLCLTLPVLAMPSLLALQQEMDAVAAPLQAAAEEWNTNVGTWAESLWVVEGVPAPHSRYISTILGASMEAQPAPLILCVDCYENFAGLDRDVPAAMQPWLSRDHGRNPAGFGDIRVFKLFALPPAAELCVIEGMRWLRYADARFGEVTTDRCHP